MDARNVTMWLVFSKVLMVRISVEQNLFCDICNDICKCLLYIGYIELKQRLSQLIFHVPSLLCATEMEPVYFTSWKVFVLACLFCYDTVSQLG